MVVTLDMIGDWLGTDDLSNFCEIIQALTTGLVSNLYHICNLHEMAGRPLAQFDVILAWASWKLLWAT